MFRLLHYAVPAALRRIHPRGRREVGNSWSAWNTPKHAHGREPDVLHAKCTDAESRDGFHAGIELPRHCGHSRIAWEKQSAKWDARRGLWRVAPQPSPVRSSLRVASCASGADAPGGWNHGHGVRVSRRLSPEEDKRVIYANSALGILVLPAKHPLAMI